MRAQRVPRDWPFGVPNPKQNSCAGTCVLPALPRGFNGTSSVVASHSAIFDAPEGAYIRNLITETDYHYDLEKRENFSCFAFAYSSAYCDMWLSSLSRATTTEGFPLF